MPDEQVATEAQPEPDPLAILRQVIQEALSPLAKKVDFLSDETAKLREEVKTVQQLNYAEGVPAHLRKDDPSVSLSRMSVARSVTLATRPVMEHPEQYNNPVTPDGIVRNSKSNPIREE